MITVWLFDWNSSVSKDITELDVDHFMCLSVWLLASEWEKYFISKHALNVNTYEALFQTSGTLQEGLYWKENSKIETREL